MADDVEMTDSPLDLTPPPLLNKRSFTLDRDKIAQKVIRDYDQDVQDRADWTEARLQRYAKYRGWLEPKNYPWPNAANAHIPLLMTDSQGMQDTLHNAVLGQRPVMSAEATNQADKEKGPQVDELQDYQLFVEQAGEEKIGEIIDSFVNDGTFVAFQAWIREMADGVETTILQPPPPGMTPHAYLQQKLSEMFPQRFIEPKDPENPFKWVISWTDEFKKEQKASAEVYTDSEQRWTMIVKQPHVVYDGPCLFPKNLEDVVVPTRAANLQPPGPSNPGGADHVVMVDYPSKDEIQRHFESGYYDLLTDEDLAAINPVSDEGVTEPGKHAKDNVQDPDRIKTQKDQLEGRHHGNAESAHKTLTRLIYFGRHDIDGDGLEEEVVFWVLYEHKLVCKAMLLGELFPSMPQRRPFAEARLIPVPGYFYGIGLLEMLEHLHDLIKMVLDQSLDKNTLGNTPWGLYRTASSVRPEVITMSPGEFYPTSNPREDFHFPPMPNMDQSFSLNMIGLISQWAEKQVVLGDLQFGRVPQGKASALRTTTGMMSVLQKGDARPERILRRFFRGLAQIYENMHVLNQAYLSPNKQYRVMGMQEPGKDPYRVLDDPSKIRGRFQFEFKANSLNTNKAMKSQILQQGMSVSVNGLTMQAGLMNPEKIYNLLRDWWEANGQDPHKYLAQPSADVDKPKLTAEEALSVIFNGFIPDGIPAEGTQAHLQKIQTIIQQQRVMFGQAEQAMLQKWMASLQARLQQEQQLAAMAQQFAQMQAGSGGGGGGAQPGEGSGQGAGAQPFMGPNQVADEMSLSGVNGGGAGGIQ